MEAKVDFVRIVTWFFFYFKVDHIGKWNFINFNMHVFLSQKEGNALTYHCRRKNKASLIAMEWMMWWSKLNSRMLAFKEILHGSHSLSINNLGKMSYRCGFQLRQCWSKLPRTWASNHGACKASSSHDVASSLVDVWMTFHIS